MKVVLTSCFVLSRLSLVCGLYNICMVFAFLFRMHILMVHLWLLRADVEASVSGSMEVEEGWGNLPGMP